tara:strand:+ start:1568 stop:2233 length:666 start_codon:yes stop_codon:yes gene_type:complete
MICVHHTNALCYACSLSEIDYVMRFILASQSPQRKRILAQVIPTFDTQAPHVDERPLPGEKAATLVERLAQKKAEAIDCEDTTVVIAGDQVICVQDTILGKPSNYDDAVGQLLLCSGKTAISYTCLYVIRPSHGLSFRKTVTTTIHYRELSSALIESYLKTDQPYDCAGSIRLESNGYLLMHEMVSEDPQAIYGMPMFALIDALITAGCPPEAFIQPAKNA